MSIEIRDIKDIPVPLYGPEGEFIGTIETELQFNDVRCQIQEQNLDGYSIIFEGVNYPIESNGRLYGKFPSNLFCANLDLLCKLAINMRE